MKIILANFTKMVNDSGGLAKVTCDFANEMYLRGHDVTLVYSDVQEGDFFYSLDANIKDMISVIFAAKLSGIHYT